MSVSYAFASQYAESEEMMELKDATCMSILKLTMVGCNAPGMSIPSALSPSPCHRPNTRGGRIGTKVGIRFPSGRYHSAT